VISLDGGRVVCEVCEMWDGGAGLRANLLLVGFAEARTDALPLIGELRPLEDKPSTGITFYLCLYL
jgi:hypothetical protein